MAISFKISPLQMKEYGVVSEIKQGIAHVTGLTNCMNGQLVHFDGGSQGTIVGFDNGYELVMIVKEGAKLKPGDKLFSTIESCTVPVGDQFLGRMVNGLGEPIDGLGPIKADRRQPIFNQSPSVLERTPLKESLETGVKILDMMNPVGKGQRQLILGDRVTGKTTIATDTILNQRGKGVICIYCCIGKAEASLNKVLDLFRENGVMEYGLIVSATAASAVGQQYLAPYVAASLGEYFMEKGRDVFVVFDDLTKHAWVYRQMSLLLERSPGRDAYPGDIFYLHSQLVERAGKLRPERGSGSMTFFPIVETVQGDVTGYIPTNIISMTDGQIYVSTPLFTEGFKPAIDIGLSVSRIGSKVQWPAMRKLAGILRLEYIQYKELEKLTRIKAGVSAAVEKRLQKGKVVAEILKQDKNAPVPIEHQVIILYALANGFMENLKPDQVGAYQAGVLAKIKAERPDLIQDLIHKKDLTEQIKEGIHEQLTAYGDGAIQN
ncbi:MAG: F0F1 ATP synthase subunit alpha [bacterium]|jgi:F-type H+-transporting ATPase subunit alpha